jgi:hypothetical protein
VVEMSGTFTALFLNWRLKVRKKPISLQSRIWLMETEIERLKESRRVKGDTFKPIESAQLFRRARDLVRLKERLSEYER